MDMTRSMEDYLRVVHDLSRDTGRVRVADIARARGVSMASVCEALAKLDREGLLEYQKGASGTISLTGEGARAAGRLSSTHDFLVSFLRDLLGVNPSDAEKDACSMEHVLSRDTLSHLVAFQQFADSRSCGGERLRDAYLRSEPRGGEEDGPPRHGRHGHGAGGGAVRAGTGLSDIPEGSRARIVHLHAACRIRQRLADMGILPGVEVEVLRRAPLGGPVEIALDGFALSLRRAEARSVEVEPLA